MARRARLASRGRGLVLADRPTQPIACTAATRGLEAGRSVALTWPWPGGVLVRSDDAAGGPAPTTGPPAAVPKMVMPGQT